MVKKENEIFRKMFIVADLVSLGIDISTWYMYLYFKCLINYQALCRTCGQGRHCDLQNTWQF